MAHSERFFSIILKINHLFYIGFVIDFLFRTICPVLNYCTVLGHPAKSRSLAKLAWRARDYWNYDGMETHGSRSW